MWNLDKVGPEPKKSHKTRSENGFYSKYCFGRGLDIGHGGNHRCAFIPNAIGVDKDYPLYDGVHLPFGDNEFDFVFSSHCLEHICADSISDTIVEWFRVVKVGGHLVIVVPHRDLYEKKTQPPSLYNSDHKVFFQPWRLLLAVENALAVNTYRIRHLRDNDDGFDYTVPPDKHSLGCYEIELVIQKIVKPDWQVI